MGDQDPIHGLVLSKYHISGEIFLVSSPITSWNRQVVDSRTGDFWGDFVPWPGLGRPLKSPLTWYIYHLSEELRVRQLG